MNEHAINWLFRERAQQFIQNSDSEEIEVKKSQVNPQNKKAKLPTTYYLYIYQVRITFLDKTSIILFKTKYP